jgi:hypothetical protein
MSEVFSPTDALATLCVNACKGFDAAAAVRPSMNKEGGTQYIGEVDGVPVCFIFAWGPCAEDVQIPDGVAAAIRAGRVSQWVDRKEHRGKRK